MGSLTLIAVPHQESDLAVLQKDVLGHRNEMARSRMLTDPVVRRKVMEILSE
jgi:hypothetical protein